MKKLSINGNSVIPKAIVFSLVLFIVSGCEDIFRDPSAIRPKDPGKKTVDFGIVLFDGDGVEGTSFRVGTDVQLALKLVTDGGKMLGWNKVDECSLYSNREFLLVYKSNESLDKPPTMYYPLGTPYHQIPISCNNIDEVPDYISAGTVILSFPWSGNPDNEPLVAGRYYATASFDLRIDGELKRFELRNDFEIYN